jgi:hypothetical protein
MTRPRRNPRALGDHASAIDARHLYFGLRSDLNVAIVAVFVLDGDPSSDDVSVLFGTLPTLVPRMGQTLVRSRFDLGAPRWRDVELDLDRHVSLQEWGGRNLAEVYGFASAWQAVEWDLSIPLWQATFISGIEGNRSAIVLKVHHAIADGSALALMLRPLFDHDAPGQMDVPRPVGPEVVGASRLAAIKSDVQMLGVLLTASLSSPPPGRIGNHRRERNVSVFSFPREVWRRAATDANGNSNDLYLAVAANSLRRSEVYRSLEAFRVAMPVNLRSTTDEVSATNATGLGFLTLDGADRHLAALAEVRAASIAAKTSAETSGAASFDRFLSLLPGAVEARLALNLYSKTDALVTNVRIPGASAILGARVDHIAGPPPIIGTPVGFSLLTIGSTCALSIGADAGIVRDFARLESSVEAALVATIGSEQVRCTSRQPPSPGTTS